MAGHMWISPYEFSTRHADWWDGSMKAKVTSCPKLDFQAWYESSKGDVSTILVSSFIKNILQLWINTFFQCPLKKFIYFNPISAGGWNPPLLQVFPSP